MSDEPIKFELRHEAEAVLPTLEGGIPSGGFAPRHWREGFDSHQEALRLSLWETKQQLDALSDTEYMAARTRVFPTSVAGGRRHQFTNRAGFKLLEAMEAVNVWRQLQSVFPSPSSSFKEGEPLRRPARKRSRGKKQRLAFADICGGPGSFSQALFAESRRFSLPLEGYGLTLKSEEGLDWYDDLRRSEAFTVTYGLDGTGNIFVLANVDALVSIAGPGSVPLVVADGGFHVSKENSNYQETISSRITYAQWFCGLKLLAAGGCFVVKMFDTFSPLTRAVLFLSTFFYRQIWIVKPPHSRVVNSERYLVCMGFIAVPPHWMRHLEQCFEHGFESSERCVPQLIPPEWIHADAVFTHDLDNANTKIAERQISSLHLVLEEVRKMKEEKVDDEEPGEVA